MLAFSFYLNFEGEFQMLVYESTKLNNNFNIFIYFVDFFRVSFELQNPEGV
jgi:hypothetical protein